MANLFPREGTKAGTVTLGRTGARGAFSGSRAGEDDPGPRPACEIDVGMGHPG